ncbi:uncharacterized protein LOC128919780 [Zeugodacus cucurbitae]|uniref:Putative BTB/POZ domain-containing protein L275 n=1 Tax=Zeugodacus cucurbitae TaxID=28588 RepID=A0A0A1WI28_ZEUCU|nr:uncharacterized protein LOC128919780 [Zeugodacus cucurbitae]XP_054082902.1 uncharacterized protein LOC128919780 [Zeugodacus cucurbitae]
MASNNNQFNNFNQAIMDNKENLAPSTSFGAKRQRTAIANFSIPVNDAGEFFDVTEHFTGNIECKTRLKVERTVGTGLFTDLEQLATENGGQLLMAQQPQPKLNFNMNFLPHIRKMNTKQLLDLTRSTDTIQARLSTSFLGLDTPNVTPQKCEMPTGVNTSSAMVNSGIASTIARPFGAQPMTDIAVQVLTSQLPKPIAIIQPSTNNNFSLKRELPVDIPSSSNAVNIGEMQQSKKLKKTVPLMTDLVRKYIEKHTIIENGTELVKIGRNGTTLQKQILEEINWNGTGAAITRKLLTCIFDRETLATHTISGRPSPAFLDVNKPRKGQLNPLILSDLIEFMAFSKRTTPREVKIAVSTKCADECKQYRRQEAAASTSAQIRSTLETMQF